MNKFFVPNEVYEDRIAICKGCVYYKSLLGNCSICKCFRAKDQAAKKRMIETYNTIYNTNFNVRTNCGSCISTCFDGIKKLYNEYK